MFINSYVSIAKEYFAKEKRKFKYFIAKNFSLREN